MKFELEDIDGQFEDLAGRFEQARLKNDDLIRKQTKLEAACEQYSEKLSALLLALTEQYKISFSLAISSILFFDE